MAVFNLRVNGEQMSVDVPPDMPLLWALRDHLDLTGTKYSCGIAFCGSCTVLLDGQPIRSCATPVESVGDREVTTIEGLSQEWGPSPPESLVGRTDRSVRVLPPWAASPGRGSSGGKPSSHRRRDRPVHGRESLPVWNLPEDPEGHSPGRGREDLMTTKDLSRRDFMKTTGAGRGRPGHRLPRSLAPGLWRAASGAGRGRRTAQRMDPYRSCRLRPCGV